MNLCYATKIKMRPDFTKEVLIDFLNEWLSTRNKRSPGQVTLDEIPCKKEAENIILEVKDYETQKIMSIHYIFRQENSQMSYYVDLIFQYGKSSHILHMHFYKELGANGKLMENISIPNLFYQILSSSYVYSDYGFNYHIVKHIPSARFSEESLYHSFNLPLVLIKGKDRFNFSHKLIGNAHVIIYSELADNTIEVRLPSQEAKIFESNHASGQKVIKLVREYCTSKLYDHRYSIATLEKEAIRQNNKTSATIQLIDDRKNELIHEIEKLELFIVDLDREIEDLKEQIQMKGKYHETV